MRMYGSGEAIVRQDAPGQSMFVVCSGSAAVVLEPDRREVATIDQGGYFGEMSLLTGDPRSATVLARGDTVVLEVSAESFRGSAREIPKPSNRLGLRPSPAERSWLRPGCDAERRRAVAPATLLDRMKKFLRLR
jgi:CRP-like cAMP-binding protein